MAVDVVLLYPPSCDPTAPYLAVPTLTGFLRTHGVSVLPIDANLEAADAILSPGFLAGVRDRLETRLGKLERAAALDHAQRLEYAALWGARGDAHAVPHGIDRAKAILRDRERFYDAAQYADATATIDAAMRAISAAYHPLHVDFCAYRTPFALTSPEEIAHDARPENDPYHTYVTGDLLPRLAAAAPRVIGISVCFPGQLAPAYQFARLIKAALPDVHLTVGGPAITQMMIRLAGTRLAKALDAFDSAVVFEGERPLLALARAVIDGTPLRALENVVVRDALQGARYLAGHGMEDLKALPAPDFEGLPLDRYLAPTLMLPYDPTRGCYWGKCTFCHYGLAEVGTASYRERTVPAMLEHLRALSARFGTHHFYFSQDSVSPKTLLKLAQGLRDAGLRLRWGTDLKPEKYLTAERARELAEGGAIACALGVESASPRILAAIDKGAPIEVVAEVIDHLAEAGVAAEAMCFTGFPTETAKEAIATLRFLEEQQDRLGVFIVGEFGLTHGALVAQEPAKYGLAETWELEGDGLGLGLFWRERRPPKTEADRARVDDELDRVAASWLLRPYPWAGAVSTTHTLLYYDRFGPGVFRELAARAGRPRIFGHAGKTGKASFDVARAHHAADEDAAIWHELTHVRRRVSRREYEELARRAPAQGPKPSVYRYAAGTAPRARATGRRPSTRPNRAG